MSSDDLLVLWTCLDLGERGATHAVDGATVTSSKASILDIGPVLPRQRRLSYDSSADQPEEAWISRRSSGCSSRTCMGHGDAKITATESVGVRAGRR